MSTESGFPYLDQPETVEAEDTVEADEASAVPARDTARPPRTLPTASPLTPEDEEALRKIAESLGGSTGGKLSLRLRRFRRGEGLKSIRAIALERWMFEDGFDLEKVIGEHYGDGKYHWEIRNSGKYFKCGVCDIETYGTFTGDDEVEAQVPQPAPEIAPIDLSGLVSQLKSDLLSELRPKEVAQPSVDIAGMVRSALEPVIRVLETKATEKTSDPSIAAVLGLLSQQNQTLMSLVGKALETPRANPAPVAGADPIDSFGKLLDIARQLQPSVFPIPALGGNGDGDDPDDDGDDYEEPAGEPEPPKSFGQRLADTVAGSFGRLTEQFVLSNEKTLSGALSGAPATAQSSPVIEAPAATTPSPVQAVEALISGVEQFVREKRPVGEFLATLTAGTSPEFMSTVKQLSVDQIVSFGASIGRPDLSERFRQPDVLKYLGDALVALKGGDGK